MEAINLAEKLVTFSDPWQPRSVSRFHGHEMVAEPLC